jgi:creatinine amidohydrolase
MAEQKHRLQDMTWAEFRDRLPEAPVVLLPMGAQEEQGPNAPMGDFVLAERIADAVARRAGAIMAPVLPYGDSEFFRTLPGCMSLRPETLVSVVVDLCASLLDHGLTHLVILNGQTSNAPSLETATRRLKAKYGLMIPCIHLWRVFPNERWQKLLPPDATGVRTGHGGDPITSMYLHYFPELVRADLIPERRPWKQAIGLPTRSVSSVDFRGIAVGMPLDIAAMTEDGVLSGDSRFSTPAIGADIAEFVTDFAAAFVTHFRTQNPRAE